jgi:hypothetical protein
LIAFLFVSKKAMSNIVDAYAMVPLASYLNDFLNRAEIKRTSLKLITITNKENIEGLIILNFLNYSGVFEIIFQVTVQNTGELVVFLNNSEILMTVVGKSGNGTIVGVSIITTPGGSNSILSINNPSTGSNGGLQIDAATGALSKPLSCHLIIKQIA